MYKLLDELLYLNIDDISYVKEIDSIDNYDLSCVMKSNIFLSDEFNNTIKKFIGYQTSISYNNNKIYIFNNINDKNKINKIIDGIKIIINYLNNFVEIKGMKLYIILSDVEKNLINKKYLLNGDNINSGLCSYEYIYIWREEELFKVLIHEMIHFFKLDKHEIAFKDYKNDLMILGNNNYNLNINETYTELLALIINSIIYTIIKYKDNRKQNFIENYKYEVINSYNNVIKVLKYYDINNFNELYTKNNFNQETNVFSYVIIKFLLMFYVEELNIFYKDKNNKIGINNENINEYVKIVKKVLKNNKYIELINKNLNKENNFNKKNLKLSIYNIL